MNNKKWEGSRSSISVPTNEYIIVGKGVEGGIILGVKHISSLNGDDFSIKSSGKEWVGGWEE